MRPSARTTVSPSTCSRCGGRGAGLAGGARTVSARGAHVGVEPLHAGPRRVSPLPRPPHHRAAAHGVGAARARRCHTAQRRVGTRVDGEVQPLAGGLGVGVKGGADGMDAGIEARGCDRKVRHLQARPPAPCRHAGAAPRPTVSRSSALSCFRVTPACTRQSMSAALTCGAGGREGPRGRRRGLRQGARPPAAPARHPCCLRPASAA
jgi:hypothetical protein